MKIDRFASVIWLGYTDFFQSFVSDGLRGSMLLFSYAVPLYTFKYDDDANNDEHYVGVVYACYSGKPQKTRKTQILNSKSNLPMCTDDWRKAKTKLAPCEP